MIEGYCVKCKAKRPIADAVEELMKNGRKAVKGKCPNCGAVMFKILGGKPASPSSAPKPPSDTLPEPAPDAPPPGGSVTESASAPSAAPASSPAPEPTDR